VLDILSARGFGSARLIQAIARAVQAQQSRPNALAVALSGGADSAMMAVHAALYGRRQGLPIHFLHIHHGLQEPATHWQSHVHALAHGLRVPCHSLRVQVDLEGGLGVEGAARDARYRGLAYLAQVAGVRHVLLAHHLGDQAETVLLRLLRGAGPTGLKAMAPFMQRDGLIYMRPWLEIDRSVILEQAGLLSSLTGWEPVHDPTNADDQYTRAALRGRLAPVLDARWPGWRGILGRHAQLSAEAALVLDEVARADWASLEPGDDGSFSLEHWRALPPARQSLVLRHWFSEAGLGMPTQARLADLMRQLRGLHAKGHDRHMCVRHGDVRILCERGRVRMERGRVANA